ncbi:MAG: MFS transporter [Roseateles depolymerans]|uniref:MFS transporter n=1 Tax=Roseateles depolymerans TaxID=76731 RepID=A0A2W5DGM5_9BURK|nr:MAG: MFS transporter [Roseateles depolymerans]
MPSALSQLRQGHWPTLLAAFVFFDCGSALWVLNGALMPVIADRYALGPADTGLLISLPLLSGALLSLPLGLLAQRIGRRRVALASTALLILALLWAWAWADSPARLLALGPLLGLGGAGFGVALSLGAGSYPPRAQGLATGIVGSGCLGAVLVVLLAPPLAERAGWQAVYGVAALLLLLPLGLLALAARESRSGRSPHTAAHLHCLLERDAWALSLIHVVTFGGFVGLSVLLPSYYHQQFGLPPVQAGQLTLLATLLGVALRAVGGALADRIGGVRLLTGVLSVVAATLVGCGMAEHALVPSTLLMLLCFAALGLGHGALFQLVPLRWPQSTAIAASLIAAVGALGGGLLPNVMALSLQRTGSHLGGFLAFAALSILTLGVLRIAQMRWTRTWAERGGRARAPAWQMPSDEDDPVSVVSLR